MEKSRNVTRSRSRKSAALIGLAAGISLTATACGDRPHPTASSEQSQTTPSIAPHSPISPQPAVAQSPSIQDGVGALRPLKSVEQKPIPSSIVKNVQDAAVRLQGKNWSCSGLILNGYVVTAGHCFAQVTHNEEIDVYQSGESKPMTAIKQWTAHIPDLTPSPSNPGVKTEKVSQPDIALARTFDPVSNSSLDINFIEQDSYRPAIGELFTASGFPKGVKQSVTGQMTYVGSDAYPKMYVAATTNPTAIASQMCLPGWSGTAYVGANLDVAIANTYTSDNDQIRQEESASGVDLHERQMPVCSATLITENLYNGMVAELNRYAEGISPQGD